MITSDTANLNKKPANTHWLVSGIVLLTLSGYGALAWLSCTQHISIFQYLCAMLLLWVGQFFLIKHLDKEFSLNKNQVILLSIAAHLIGVFSIPVLDDDYARYLWDGYIYLQYGNPYLFAPEYFFADEYLSNQWADVLDLINYPEVKTVYGPVAQALFLLSCLLSAANVTVLKMIITFFNFSILFALRDKISITQLTLIALCPLFIFETSFSGHVDSLGAYFLLMAVLIEKKKPGLSAVALALACGVKWIALLLVPAILWRQPLRNSMVFSAILLLILSPFLLNDSSAFLSGSAAFFSHREYNSFIFSLLTVIVSPFFAKVIIVFFLALLYGYVLKNKNKENNYALYSLLLLYILLSSPVINPWYVLWLLPLATLTPFISPWVFSAAVCLAYVNGLHYPELNLPSYHHPWWLRPIEFIPVVIAIIYDLKNWIRTRVNAI